MAASLTLATTVGETQGWAGGRMVTQAFRLIHLLPLKLDHGSQAFIMIIFVCLKYFTNQLTSKPLPPSLPDPQDKPELLAPAPKARPLPVDLCSLPLPLPDLCSSCGSQAPPGLSG